MATQPEPYTTLSTSQSPNQSVTNNKKDDKQSKKKPTNQQLKKETLASIDAALAIMKYKPDIDLDNLNISIDGSNNPFPFLVELLKNTVGYNNLLKIISKFISFELPAIELAVKGVILSKLKDIISCSVNPFLTKEVLQKGIVLNIEEIDLTNMLNMSPFNQDFGNILYFGMENISTTDGLITADDMNAFIWYMKNRATKRYVWKPKKYRKDAEFRKDYPKGFGVEIFQQEPEEYRRSMENKMVTVPLKKAKDICGEKRQEYAEIETRVYKEWEQFKANYTQKLKKEDGIVTFEYHKNPKYIYDASGKKMNLQTPYNNVLHVFIGDARENQNNADVNKLNSLEKKLQKRQKTYEAVDNKRLTIKNQIKEINKLINEVENSLTNENVNLIIRQNLGDLLNERVQLKKALEEQEKKLKKMDGFVYSFRTQVMEQAAEVSKNAERFFPFLYSEYNRNYYYGKTLAEFNVDYIWSIQLFDEKTLASQLINSLTEVITIKDYNISYKRQVVKNEVKKMVEKITESDDIVVSDCFFTFTNEDYDSMSRRTELLKSGMMPTDSSGMSAYKINAESVLKSLNEINENTSKEEAQTIIEGTLRNLSKEVTEYEKQKSDELSVKVNFIENILQKLAEVLVMSVLSPKVYILLLINLKVIGRETNYNLEGFIGQYKNLISQIVRSIRDKMLSFFKDELMNIIGNLIKDVQSELFKEQSQYYTKLYRQLVECFKWNRHKLKKENGFTIDDVDYADILEGEEEPINNENC